MQLLEREMKMKRDGDIVQGDPLYVQYIELANSQPKHLCVHFKLTLPLSTVELNRWTGPNTLA